MACSFRHEQSLHERGIFPVAGIDEAGRGPLAGPVVAAAVILPRDVRGLDFDDSKKLTPARRDRLYDRLTADSRIAWAVSVQPPEAIDRRNILRATHDAMRASIAALRVRPMHALIDGLPVAPFPIPSSALVGGDALSLSIAAASIVAKVTRDRIMEAHAREFPEYGFERHKGYATAGHLASLRKHGPCPIHRRSFAPVAQLAPAID